MPRAPLPRPASMGRGPGRTVGHVFVLDVVGGVQVDGLGQGLQLRPGRVEAQVLRCRIWLAFHHPVLPRTDLRAPPAPSAAARTCQSALHPFARHFTTHSPCTLPSPCLAVQACHAV